MDYVDLSHKVRLIKLNLLLLSYRRDFCCIKCLVNSYLGSLQLQEWRRTDGLLQFRDYSNIVTRGLFDTLLLHVPICETTVFKRSSSNSVVHIWNSLPVSLRGSIYGNMFYTSLRKLTIVLISYFYIVTLCFIRCILVTEHQSIIVNLLFQAIA